MVEGYKAIILIGKAGSGKDSLAREICQTIPQNFNFVVSATTRPQRDYEINGIDYKFLTQEEFEKEEKIEESCFNSWYYGTLLSSLEKDKINILVLNPKGVKSLWNQNKVEILDIIQLKVTDKERLIRQLNREKNPNVDEIIRRYSADKKDFEEFADWCTKHDLFITRLKNEDALDFKSNYNYILGRVN